MRGKCYGLGEKHDAGLVWVDYGEKTDLTHAAKHFIKKRKSKVKRIRLVRPEDVESHMLCNTVIVEQPEEDDDRVH